MLIKCIELPVEVTSTSTEYYGTSLISTAIIDENACILGSQYLLLHVGVGRPVKLQFTQDST